MVSNGGWTVVQDEEGALGPYTYRGDQWVSFDDVDIIRKKSELVRSKKLGGAMIWALDLDDFRNKCGCETYPLLKTINRVLRNYPAASANCAVKSIVLIFSSLFWYYRFMIDCRYSCPRNPPSIICPEEFVPGEFFQTARI